MARVGAWMALAVMVAMVASAASAAAPDWPQWRGLARDGKSPDTGLAQEWPEGGPPLAWKATGIGKGYSSVAVTGGKMMSDWAYSESPLVDGEKLVCTPGGKDAVIVALNRKTGETIWKCAMPDIGSRGNFGAGYSSIVISEAGGVRQYVTLIGKGLIGAAAKDGKFLWGYNKVANGTANVTTPIVSGDYVFGSSAYNTGAGLLKLSADGSGGIKAEEVYFLDANTFQNHHGGLVLVGDNLYAGHGHGAGLPKCIEFKTGKIAWQADKAPGGGSAAVTFADGNLYFRYESGLMALVAATPDGFKLKSTFKIPVKTGPSWPHTTIQDRKLFIRDNDTLMCYDIAKK